MSTREIHELRSEGRKRAGLNKTVCLELDGRIGIECILYLRDGHLLKGFQKKDVTL